MNLREPLITELRVEAEITRKMLERLPAGGLSWKPHDKSRTLGEIAAHLEPSRPGVPGSAPH